MALRPSVAGRHRSNSKNQAMRNAVLAQELPQLSVDLLRSWERSDEKIEGWTRDEAETALLRYQRFFMLFASYPNTPLAPTRDIDAMWHLHMLSPGAYVRDCMRLVGDIVDHDGGFGKDDSERDELQRVFEHTAMLWEEMFGEPYAIDASSGVTKCRHDCVGRCWHACKSIDADRRVDNAARTPN